MSLHLLLHLAHCYLDASVLYLLIALDLQLFSVQLFDGLLADGGHYVVEILLGLLVRHRVQQDLTVDFNACGLSHEHTFYFLKHG